MFVRFRDRFLGSTSTLLLAPPDDTVSGADGADDATMQDDDTTSDQGGDDGDTTQQDDAGEGEAEGQDGESGSEDDGEEDEDDSELTDDEIAALDPKLRKKFEKRLTKETNWRDRQISRLHAQKRNTQEDNAALERIAASQLVDAQGRPIENPTAEQIRVAAENLRAKQQYDEGCDETHQKGLKAYGKDRWEGSLQKITRMGGIDIQDMQAVLATDNPHVVMHHLSADPDEYDRVMRLPPARRATEFVKISLKGEPPKKGAKPAPGQQSRATPPVTPVSGNRGMAAKRPNLYDDKMDDDAWYATRNASRRKKFSGVE